MNLITSSEFHSFNHKTKKIEIVHSSGIDLDLYALIKQTPNQIIITSFQNLDKYSLGCRVVTYKERSLYIHTMPKPEDPSGLYYHLTKKLTEDQTTLDDILGSEPEVAPEPKLEDTKPNVLKWVVINMPVILDSVFEIERQWEAYKDQTKSEISLKEWVSIVTEQYHEDLSTGKFARDAGASLEFLERVRSPAEKYNQIGKRLPTPIDDRVIETTTFGG